MLTAEQLRAARSLLRMEQSDLAGRSGVSLASIKRFEAMAGPLQGRTDTVQKIQDSLERAGVIFISENGEGPGVRLRKGGGADRADE